MSRWWRRSTPAPPLAFTHPVPVAFLLRLCQQPGTRHVLIRTSAAGARLTFAASPLASDDAVLACLGLDLRPDEWPRFDAEGP